MVTVHKEDRFIRNDAARAFTFEGVEFKGYYMIKNPSEVLGYFDIPYEDCGGGYKKFTKKYNITPKNFMSVHNAIKTRQWIDPVRDLSKKLCFRFDGRPAGYLMSKLHNNIKTLRELEQDGINNIIPLCFMLETTPKEIKAVVGKGLWKSLCKNTFTRNNLIAKMMSPYDMKYTNPAERLATLNKFPSGLLKRGNMSPVPFCDAGLWIIKNNLHKSLSVQVIRSIYNTYNDTKSMASQLGKGFVPDKWDLDKLNTKHSEFINLVNLKKYSPEKIKSLSSITVKTDNYKGYTITLLDSPLLIRNEGNEMHHCVGSYLGRVIAGDYLVYSITDSLGNKSSTIGISIDKSSSNKSGSVYRFSQHYGACNSLVTCLYEINIGNYILSKLNEEGSL